MHLAILEADQQDASLAPRWGRLADMVGAWLAPAVPGLSLAAVPVTGGGADGGALPDPSGFDGFVVTGSRASAYDCDPWIARLAAYLRTVQADGRPILGLCFGHQILAAALGGRVERIGWRVGLTRLAAPGLGPLADGTAQAHVWHQDQVVARPPDAEVLAAYPGCRVGALGYAGRALGLQWHPEYPPDYMAALLAVEGKAHLPGPVWHAAVASVGGRHDGPRTAQAAAAYLGWR